MTLLQVAQREQPSAEWKAFCNALRCPLCGGQLDGNVHPKKARLYCVNDNNEYKITWTSGKPEPDYELIRYVYTQYEYVIEYDTDWLGNRFTVVNRYNMDAHPIHRAKTKVEVFKCGTRILFFRKRLDENVFLNKLKLYNVFS